WVEIDEQLEVIKEVDSLIDPEIPIPAHISGVTNITDEDVHEAPTIEEFFKFECSECLKQPTILVAHNASFDLKFFKRHTDQITDTVCTVRLARKYFPDLDNHKLATLKYHFDLGKSGGHRALYDVLITLDFLKIVMKEAGMTLSELIAESKKPIQITHMPFGKYKGAALAAVPMSYTNWLSKQDSEKDPDLVAAFLKIGRRI
ncbi:MAG: DUF3820 family protein, partial [Candidatus Peribacteraceae bacterium]|nr:DUF3820 family protein [Candidatus Peribacteraceae bacterium]